VAWLTVGRVIVYKNRLGQDRGALGLNHKETGQLYSTRVHRVLALSAF
jgi:hypothetical protein